MKIYFSTHLSLSFAFCLLALSACTEAPTVATEAPALGSQNEATLSAKPNCDVDPSHPTCAGDGGGTDGSAPMYARLVNSGNATHAANELVDADNEGGRLGAWAAGLGLLWDGTQFVRDDVNGPATSPDCPGIKFGLIEANMRKGDVTTLWVRGYDGTSDYSSDKIALTPQAPNDAGWTLDIQQYIDISTGKGQSQSIVCTVYVHQIEYELVNP